MIILSTNLYQSWKKSIKSSWNNLKLLIIKFEISFEFKKKNYFFKLATYSPS